MIIGVPKERKDKEFRVGIVPEGVQKLSESGHTVLIESGAGIGSAIDDEEFVAAGAEIVQGAKTVYSRADMIMKVKEPLEQEYNFMRKDLIII